MIGNLIHRKVQPSKTESEIENMNRQVTSTVIKSLPVHKG